jgi:histidyl-tRNA synthetase
MGKQKPSIPQGTRDFSPEILQKRNYIFDTIKTVFRKFGYQPLETPAMENLSTLLGKYGDEGDKLLFKILNSGNFLKEVSDSELTAKDTDKIAGLISNKGLRYDLTVPFARYVVQHQNEITFPFKRFQIQPVWRADRPQKGRYREFFQCDADVIGTDSMLNEFEIVQMIEEIFLKLKIRVSIRINNRKILAGIAEICGFPDKIIDLTVAIDKLDKIGFEKVSEELISKGFSQNSIENIKPLLEFSGNTDEKLKMLEKILIESEIAKKGIEDMRKLFYYINEFSFNNEIKIDLSLARGLNYYTGAIFEVTALDTPMGSICGGGRYDDLTGVFGMPGMSGVGISFGADRIFDVMGQLNIFPETDEQRVKILFINFGEKEEKYCLPILAKIRDAGINAEIYPQNDKMKKQMSYADKKNIEYTAMVGENEINQSKIMLKNMKTGEQVLIDVKKMIEILEK